MILLTTYDSDEKFQIKSVLGLGKKLEKVIIINDAKESDKNKKSLSSFIQFLDGLSISYEIIKIDSLNFINSVSKILSSLDVDKEIIANLSGGDKILMIETLIALALSGKDIPIEIESDKYDTKITFSISDLIRGDINADHIKILVEIMRGSRTIYKISKSTRMSTSSVSRKLKKLLEYKYIIKENTEYSLTYKGMILALMQDLKQQ
ncbi:ArsR family transcriptional regulator [Acidianus manzaensis]|uniref:Uncharacterized protein n=1 Tax=Acidianus manzaensis TaxID=282676 RepID=A0A1W6K2J7_9CREN|nr:ArsR family transcriptional regulator [Acidianus manzaensis]ARM76664.1 hypothetical protein B6F84_12000 [Acidianus manzaensis]